MSTVTNELSSTPSLFTNSFSSVSPTEPLKPGTLLADAQQAALQQSGLAPDDALPSPGAALDIPQTGRLDKNKLLMDVSALLIMLIQFYRALRMSYRDAEVSQLEVEVAAMKGIAEKMKQAADEMLDARLAEAISGIVMGAVEAAFSAGSLVSSMKTSSESRQLQSNAKQLRAERKALDSEQVQLAQQRKALNEPKMEFNDNDGGYMDLNENDLVPRINVNDLKNRTDQLDLREKNLNQRRETLATEEHTRQMRRQVTMQGMGALTQAGKSVGSLCAGLSEYQARTAEATQKLIETVQKTAEFGRGRAHEMSAESTEMMNNLLRTLDQLWKDEQGMQQVLLQKFA